MCTVWKVFSFKEFLGFTVHGDIFLMKELTGAQMDDDRRGKRMMNE